jgi:hypothetical protein
MAYDGQLEKRLNQWTAQHDGFYQQKMFGGVGYLLRGNMCFGIWKDHLILRLGEAPARDALKKKDVKPFDITGRAMKGWVMVAPEGMKSEIALRRWITQAVDFVSQLPRK